MFNSSSSKLVIFCVGIFFLVAFVSNFVNIGFRHSNNKLERSIEQLEDEKSILRANYLSEIALDKLSSKAGQMQMKHASSEESYRVSKKVEKKRLDRLMLKPKAKFQDKVLLVSGY